MKPIHKCMWPVSVDPPAFAGVLPADPSLPLSRTDPPTVADDTVIMTDFDTADDKTDNIRIRRESLTP